MNAVTLTRLGALLLALVFVLPDPMWLIGPLLTIVYAIALAVVPAGNASMSHAALA